MSTAHEQLDKIEAAMRLIEQGIEIIKGSEEEEGLKYVEGLNKELFRDLKGSSIYLEATFDRWVQRASKLKTNYTGTSRADAFGGIQ